MHLPADKGTYILIARVSQMKRLTIGSLGEFDIIPGFYAYVGSAFGFGGLRARIGHHLESTAEPHWHIDYLLEHPETEITHVVIIGNPEKMEHKLAGFLADLNETSQLAPRLGAQDTRNSSHLLRVTDWQKILEQLMQYIPLLNDATDME